MDPNTILQFSFPILTGSTMNFYYSESSFKTIFQQEMTVILNPSYPPQISQKQSQGNVISAAATA
jgi:hypothetical protein